MQKQIVIYSVGAALLVDMAESLFRCGIGVAGAIKNMEGESFLFEDVPLHDADNIPAALKDLPFIVPCFTPAHRQTVYNDALKHGFKKAFTLVDASVPMPRVIEMGDGCYINSGCTLGSHSRFGEFVAINRGASIGHHAEIGAFVSVGPGVTIAGRVKIGKGAFIGAGAVVVPEITIGENAVIGAGAVVTKDVPAQTLVVGNPARMAKQGIAGFDGKKVV